MAKAKKYVGKIDCKILGESLVRVTGASSPEDNKVRVEWVKTLEKLALKDSRDAIRTLDAIRAGTLSIHDAYTGASNPKVLKIVTGETPDALLWPTLDAWLAGPCAPTPVSCRALKDKLYRLPQASGLSREKPVMISDLAKVNWEDRWMQHWGMYSTNSWNTTRQAVGAFLTAHFGSEFSLQRKAIMLNYHSHEAEKLPKPPCSEDEFLAIVEHLEDVNRPMFMVMALTGLRMAEMLRLEKGHLVPDQHGIALKKRGERRVSKTRTGTGTLKHVPPQYWGYVEQAVPVPTRPAGELSLQEYLRLAQRFSKAWKRATTAAGRPDLTPHHLRTAYIRWNVKAGVPVEVTQRLARHRNIQQTMDYYHEAEQQQQTVALGGSMDAAFARRAAQTNQVAGHIGAAKVG